MCEWHEGFRQYAHRVVVKGVSIMPPAASGTKAGSALVPYSAAHCLTCAALNTGYSYVATSYPANVSAVQ